MVSYTEYFPAVSIEHPFGVTEVRASDNVTYTSSSMLKDVVVEIEDGILKIYKNESEKKGRLMVASSNYNFQYVERL